MMNRTLSILAALVLALGSATAQAQRAAQPQALVVTAENRTAAADAARRDDRAARPGDVMRYRLTFTNVAGRPIRGVTLANPLPAGIRMVAGTARASREDARAEYSADGGRTFSAQPMEDVVVDGRTVRRPVPAERYTHVRWTVDGSVAAGATVVAEYDARIGAPPAGSGTAGSAAGNGGR